MAHRVLLISKARWEDTPIVCVRVVSFDAATGVTVEGNYGHRWTMTKAEAKKDFDLFRQELTDAEPTGVRPQLQAGSQNRQGAG